MYMKTILRPLKLAGLLSAGAIALGGCAAAPRSSVERLSPEQLAAIPLPGPAQAEQATRLTQQADREAQQARSAQQQREAELARWREYDRRYNWSLGVGHWGYPRGYGWGAGYYFR
jgi:hypothetical protein